jgi:hypothetical protein
MTTILRKPMTRKKKIQIITTCMIIFGASWWIFNIFVTNPAHEERMKSYDQKIAICDQKLALLDKASAALDQGDRAVSQQLEAQANSIPGC